MCSVTFSHVSETKSELQYAWDVLSSSCHSYTQTLNNNSGLYGLWGQYFTPAKLKQNATDRIANLK